MAAALGEDYQQKTYTDSNDSPSLEEEGKRETFLGKPLKMNTFVSLCRWWQGMSGGLFREGVNKPCRSPLEGLTSQEGGGGEVEEAAEPQGMLFYISFMIC